MSLVEINKGPTTGYFRVRRECTGTPRNALLNKKLYGMKQCIIDVLGSLLVGCRQLQAGYFKVIFQAPYFTKRLIKYLRKYLNVIVVLNVLKRENESSFPAAGSYSIMSLFPCGRVLQKFSDVCEVRTTLGITVGNDRGVEGRKYFREWWGKLVFSTGFPDRRWAVHTVETLTSESKCRYVSR